MAHLTLEDAYKLLTHASQQDWQHPLDYEAAQGEIRQGTDMPVARRLGTSVHTIVEMLLDAMGFAPCYGCGASAQDNLTRTCTECGTVRPRINGPERNDDRDFIYVVPNKSMRDMYRREIDVFADLLDPNVPSQGTLKSKIVVKETRVYVNWARGQRIEPWQIFVDHHTVGDARATGPFRLVRTLRWDTSFKVSAYDRDGRLLFVVPPETAKAIMRISPCPIRALGTGPKWSTWAQDLAQYQIPATDRPVKQFFARPQPRQPPSV